MAEYIYVQAGKKTKRGRVAILEEDKRHPLDEATNTHRVFVKFGSPPTKVAITELVAAKLQNSELMQVRDYDDAEDGGELPRSAKRGGKKTTTTPAPEADAEADSDSSE